ncbi:hypothetical protein BDN70DRAFT_312023 [Pholiota conissans]|uniref:Uncharacterized protein n=1 Tax=Pholiota conissans TaxID=109636 RepID=A0A9P6CWE6_9AGAR|nr:hypothetical protein BDN70DRAFT_312023 [Pholiota conissans]
MSSYHAIHLELLKIDQMILQASAARLIKKIHHDLVERQCKLFEKVAKLDNHYPSPLRLPHLPDHLQSETLLIIFREVCLRSDARNEKA